MSHTRRVAIASLIPGAMLCAGPEHSVPSELSIRAVVHEVVGAEDAPLRVGDLVALDATLAPRTPDRAPHPSLGDFPGHLPELSLAFERTGPTHLTGPGDLRVRALEHATHAILISAGGDLVHVEVELADPTGSALDADTHDTLELVSHLPERSLLIEMDRGSGYWFARARIHDLRLTSACACDTDRSDTVDAADLLLFIEQWILDDPGAERDGLDGISTADLLAYLDCWFPAAETGRCN